MHYNLVLHGEDIRHRSFLFFLRVICEFDKVRIMKRLQVYQFPLKTTPDIKSRIRQFSGSFRLVWNRALTLQQAHFQADGTRIKYNDLAGLLVQWKKDSRTSFLSNIHPPDFSKGAQGFGAGMDQFYPKTSRTTAV
jgi:putative transposase